MGREEGPGFIKIPSFGAEHSASKYSQSDTVASFRSASLNPDNTVEMDPHAAAMENSRPRTTPLPPSPQPQPRQAVREVLTGLSADDMTTLVPTLREAGMVANANPQPVQAQPPPRKSAKGPDVAFNAQALDKSRVVMDLHRFHTVVALKMDAEADRFPDPRSRGNYVCNRLQGRARDMCTVGLRLERYEDWQDMVSELEAAFGEVDPGHAWDKRLFSLRQGKRSFSEHVNEFRTIAQSSSFGGPALKSLLGFSLSRDLETKISAEDVGLDAFVELLQRHDRGLRTVIENGLRPHCIGYPDTMNTLSLSIRHLPRGQAYRSDVDRSRRFRSPGPVFSHGSEHILCQEVHETGLDIPD